MATGTIKSNNNLATGSISALTNISAATYTQSCYKIGNIVNAGATIVKSGMTTNGNYFQLPEGFRPRSTTKCFISISGVSGVASDVVHGLVGTISTNGNVGFSYSGSRTCEVISFMATFPI